MNEIDILDKWEPILLDMIEMLQELNEGMEEILSGKS